MADSSYRLKPGVWPMKFGSTQHISNLNISDALAEDFLRINENRIGLFTEYPSDWRSRIGLDSPAAQPVTEKAKTPKRPRIYKKKG